MASLAVIGIGLTLGCQNPAELAALRSAGSDNLTTTGAPGEQDATDPMDDGDEPVLADLGMDEADPGTAFDGDNARQITTDSRRQYVRGRLLVKFHDNAPATARQQVLSAANATVSREITQIGVKIVNLPAGASELAHLRAFRNRPEVEFAELDRVFTHAIIPNDPYYNNAVNPEWHLPKISAPLAWNTTTGSTNITIAILDSGVYGAHPDLASKMVPGWNVVDNNSNTADVNGHGTNVAGIAAAASNNGIGVASVAWGCMIMPVRVSLANGWAASSALAGGLTWAADHGAKVANMSFEGDDTFSTLFAAEQYFQNHGGVVVMSAGNSATFNPQPDNPYILKVSATDPSDLVPSWSVTGNCIDLSAPGVNIITTNSSAGYSSTTGTSASAPVVAGVVALVFSANPNLTPTQVQDILKQSTDDRGAPGWDTSYGWGRVNASRAVCAAANNCGAGDATPPVVTFMNPTAGATVSGSTTVQVSATDNVAVSSVALSLDGSQVSMDTSSPYTFAWNTSAVSNGSHTLLATATDSTGNVATAQVVVSVDNTPTADTTPPTVSFTAPASGATISGTYTVQVSAGDNAGVSSVSLRMDAATALGTDNTSPYSFSWNSTTASNGAHTLTATATDTSGNTAAATVNVTVSNTTPDTTPPTVAFTTPASGATLSGTYSVQVSAGDNIGVSSVSLRVDSTSIGTDTTSPYAFSWNTTTATNGPHTLTATAMDTAGNTATATVAVTVSNTADTTAPTINITSPANGATVGSNVTVTVSTSDNVGVIRCEAYLDGVLKKTSTNAPFNMRVRIGNASGPHTLQTRAYDAAGNVGMSPTITVYR